MLNDLRDLRRFVFLRAIEFNQGENLGYNLSRKFTIGISEHFNRFPRSPGFCEPGPKQIGNRELNLVWRLKIPDSLGDNVLQGFGYFLVEL